MRFVNDSELDEGSYTDNGVRVDVDGPYTGSRGQYVMLDRRDVARLNAIMQGTVSRHDIDRIQRILDQWSMSISPPPVGP